MALQEELKSQGDYLFKYRSYLPLALLVVGLVVKLYHVYYVGDTPFSQALESSALGVGLLGLIIRSFTVGYTPKNTSGRNTNEGQVADELNTKGIYSLIRNPLYLGNYLMWLAIAMMTGSGWFVLVFSLVFWIYYERIVYAEESFLREKFGKKYLDWTEKTPPFLPKNLNYQKPDLKFSWKKVLKKEKNGLFALFLLIAFFEVVGQYAKDGTFMIDQKWLLIATAATGLIYLVLKYLKKYTDVLNEEGR